MAKSIKGAFAHVHIALGILAAALILHRLGAPVTLLGWFGAFATLFAREMTQAEYYREIPEVGGLRANMKWWAPYRFWRWNAHSKAETAVSLGIAGLASAGIHLAFGV